MSVTADIDEVELEARKPSRLSGINQRRLQLFKANKRGFWSLWIFLIHYKLVFSYPGVMTSDHNVVVTHFGWEQKKNCALYMYRK